MRVVFRPEARVEALGAQSWYEARRIGLGFEFALALEAAVESAARRPSAHPVVEGQCRRVLLRRFPYAVVFQPGAESLLIVAVFHHRRDPSDWLGRVAR
jgi:plasmid stabilization system protein ParE